MTPQHHPPDRPFWYWGVISVGWMHLLATTATWCVETFDVTYIEIIGYFATVLNIIGNLMFTGVNAWGWVVRLLVNVLYIAYAVQVDKGMPMVVNHVAFIAINIIGWIRWREREIST